MVEPTWGVELLQSLNTFISQSELYYTVASLFADVPVFLLPVFLLWLYIRHGMVRKHISAKYGALLIFMSAVLAAAINLWLQEIIVKARPETALTGTGRLIMKHLPTASFPSDHAAVAMAVALSSLVWGGKRGKKTVKIWWRVLLVLTICMSIARVAVGVHWPTDILAGWGVSLLTVLIIFTPVVKKFLNRHVIHYLIALEQSIFGKIYKKS